MVACQKMKSIPKTTSIVIIGNGPSALFLSFLLNGNVPYYNYDGAHTLDDPILHRKLMELHSRPLYDSLEDVTRLCEHFEATGRYSSDAWPVNTLVDALLCPNMDTNWDAESAITFHKDASFMCDHVVFGSSTLPGGQWAEKTGQDDGENARTLSYSEQLSLPGYSFAQFFREEYGEEFGQFERPRRPQVSAYYARYPSRVDICGSLWNGSRVSSISRLPDGYYSITGTDYQERPFSVTCQHVVLACGLFTHMIEPPDMLLPYVGSRHEHSNLPNSPILIIGSGFSAADAIIENLGKRPIVHLYKWQTAQYTSPLKHCHRSSYPEYADVYRRMKLSSHTTTSFPDYDGIADCAVVSIMETTGLYQVTIANDATSASCTVVVGEIAFLAGRRTSLDFLEPAILQGLQMESTKGWLEKSGLREQITPIGPALTVDEGRILCIGSITGDSLVKFMFGAAMGAATRLLSD